MLQDSPTPFITCDANVYISGATVPTSPPGRILDAWRDDQIEIALSEPILDEIENVLLRPYFQQRQGWTADKVSQYRAELTASGIIVPGTTPVNVSPDPDDNKIFACAIEAGVDYIVSGDQKHVLSVGTFEGIPTVSPREFVTMLEQTQKAA